MPIRFFSLLFLFLGTGAAVAQTPALNSVIPSAGAPGQTVEVTLQGASLERPTALWTSVGAETTFTGGGTNRATYRVTVPAGAPVGIAALRLATRGGSSNLQFFMVDDLPTVAERGGNGSADGAQAIAAPVAVDGACEALALDYYRLKAKRGQRVSVEVVATRLGSALDPVVRLLDPSGRELVWADDSPGAGGDCRFAHTFAADGQYLIELRDANYDGGPAYRYRLRVGDFPLAVVPFPLGGKRGSAGMFAFLGDGCDDVPPAVATLSAGSRRIGISARRVGGGGSGFAGVVGGDLDETVEAEPNDTRQSATPLAIPIAVSGRLEAAEDVDFYKLAMRKGERVWFRARTRSLGSPCDVAMQLFDEYGKKLAASKVEGPADASFDARIPEDGTYWLRVEEITRAGGPALAYRVEAEPYRPGFSLSVETNKVDARAGGEFQLKVTCARRDYGGPIAISLEGLTPAGLEGAMIPAGKQETRLKVKLAAAMEAGNIVHFGVVGTASIGVADFRTVASTMPALRKLFPRLLYPSEELDGMIALGVRGEGR